MTLRQLAFLIIAVFVGIACLPFFTLILLTNTGIPQVSDHLATKEPTTRQVTITDPRTGQAIATLPLQTTWPVIGPVTLEFGASDLPFEVLHTGIDIAGPNNGPVTPFLAGTVSYTKNLPWGYGKYVIVDHGNHLTSLYAHLSLITVHDGQVIKPGDILGYEGQTGWATGPHVHFETRVFDIPVNPRTFVVGNP